MFGQISFFVLYMSKYVFIQQNKKFPRVFSGCGNCGVWEWYHKFQQPQKNFSFSFFFFFSFLKTRLYASWRVFMWGTAVWRIHLQISNFGEFCLPCRDGVRIVVFFSFCLHEEFFCCFQACLEKQQLDMAASYLIIIQNMEAPKVSRQVSLPQNLLVVTSCCRQVSFLQDVDVSFSCFLPEQTVRHALDTGFFFFSSSIKLVCVDSTQHDCLTQHSPSDRGR